jgi:hypothetical protein
MSESAVGGWSVVYGRVVAARASLQGVDDPSGEADFANAALLDVANILEDLGVVPAPVSPATFTASVDAALAILAAAADHPTVGVLVGLLRGVRAG